MKARYIGLTVLLSWAGSAVGQRLNINIKTLAFMSGKWVVAHPWGDMEEDWSEPLGDNMVSSYRCVKNGKIVFYEFVVIEQTDSVPVMRLRHFKPGSVAWEDQTHPENYPLVSLAKNRAVFLSSDGTVRLTYAVITANRMDVELKEKKKSGQTETTAFHYTRQ